jgi:hypothetical protein
LVISAFVRIFAEKLKIETMAKLDYHIRAYIFQGEHGEDVGNYLNGLIDAGLVEHLNTVIGKGQLVCFYDLMCSKEHIQNLDEIGGIFLPMNKYEDFVISCPEGDRIDDDMILRDYSDNTLNGYNIKCRHGYRTAVVKISESFYS